MSNVHILQPATQQTLISSHYVPIMSPTSPRSSMIDNISEPTTSPSHDTLLHQQSNRTHITTLRQNPPKNRRFQTDINVCFISNTLPIDRESTCFYQAKKLW